MPSYMKWSSTINSSKQCRHCKRRGRDKHRQIELERKKSALSKLLKVSQTYQNETLPFVGEVAGYSISRLVRCPFKRSIKTFEPWLKSRIKKCCEHGSLRPRDLQSIFGLHHYCNLNNLSQEQLKMIMLLSYLFKLAFYKGDKNSKNISPSVRYNESFVLLSSRPQSIMAAELIIPRTVIVPFVLFTSIFWARVRLDSHLMNV